MKTMAINNFTSADSINLLGVGYRFPEGEQPAEALSGRYKNYIPALKSERKTVVRHRPSAATEAQAIQLNDHGQAEFLSSNLPLPRSGEVAVALDCINLTGVNLRNELVTEYRRGYFAIGVIYSVGDKVVNWHKGDFVIVAANGNPASHVVCASTRVFSATLFEGFAPEDVAALLTTLVPVYYSLHTVARVAPGETVLIDAELGTSAIAAHSISRWLAARPRLFRCTDEGPQILDGEIVIDLSKPDFINSLTDEDRNIQARAWLHSTKCDGKISSAGLVAPNAHELVLSEDSAPSLACPRENAHSTISALKLACIAPKIFQQLLSDIAQIVLFRPQILVSAQQLTQKETLDILSDSSQQSSGSTPILSFIN